MAENNNRLDEYKSLVDLYKYYTQLSFEIIKYVLIFNITLVAALGLARGGNLKGLIGVVISALALIICFAAIVSFRKCIKHCTVFRDLAIIIEKELGFNTFSKVRALNRATKGTVYKARTFVLVFVALIAIFWVLVLLASMGVKVLRIN